MSPRASARLKERIANRPPADPPCSTTSTSRPKKKQKREVFNVSPGTDSTEATSHVRAKGRKGKLRFMTDMPMDILFEIFGQLEPIDLLHLSRATKGLRRIVASSQHLMQLFCGKWYTFTSLSISSLPLSKSTVGLSKSEPSSTYLSPGGQLETLYQLPLWSKLSLLCFHVRYLSSLHGPRTVLPGMQQNALRGYVTYLMTRSLELTAYHMCSEFYVKILHRSNGYVLKIEYDQKLRALQEIGDDTVAFGAFCREQKDLYLNRRQYGDKIYSWWVRHQGEYASKLQVLEYSGSFDPIASCCILGNVVNGDQ